MTLDGGGLIGTHILLWMRAAPEKLTAAERQALDGATRRLVSAVSLWEIAVLVGLGRVADDPRFFAVPDHFDLLPVLPEHCNALARLPRFHKDPFDRMLVAQAATEGIALLTRDGWMTAYAQHIRLAIQPA